METVNFGADGPLTVQRVAKLDGHQGAVYDLALAADGGLLSVGGDGMLVHWAPREEGFSAKGTALARVDGALFCVAACPDGSVLAGGAAGGVLRWAGDGSWEMPFRHAGGTFVVAPEGSGGADGQWVGHPGHGGSWSFPGRVRCMLEEGAGAGFWVGTSEGRIHHSDAQWSTEAHDGAVRALMRWPGRNAVASVGGDGRLIIWRPAPDGRLEKVLSQDIHKGAIYRAAADPTGRWVSTCSRDRSIALWNSEDLALALRVKRPGHPGHMRSVNALCWCGPELLASAGDDGDIILWRIALQPLQPD